MSWHRTLLKSCFNRDALSLGVAHFGRIDVARAVLGSLKPKRVAIDRKGDPDRPMTALDVTSVVFR
jgi:hypothetical protein